MNRCDLLRRRALATLLWSISVGPAAHAQIRPIPANARRGVLRVTQPPWVLLDGEPAQLSPGARIVDTDNRLVLSASLVGQDLAVAYRTDMLGLVHQVWLLSVTEAQAPSIALPVDPASTGR
ncbi:MAG: hypothetical protein OHK0048_04060 [Rhodoferax sp.]